MTIEDPYGRRWAAVTDIDSELGQIFVNCKTNNGFALSPRAQMDTQSVASKHCRVCVVPNHKGFPFFAFMEKGCSCGSYLDFLNF